jgi:hypothetical protein
MFLLRRKPLAILLLLLLVSCSQKREEIPSTSPTKAPVQLQKDTSSRKASDTTQKNVYEAYKLTGAKSLADLSDSLGKAKMFILFKINRRDLKHLKVGETLAIPNAGDSLMTYSPFPLHLASLDSIRKILIVSRLVQTFAAYENGKLIMWGPTNTGKKSTPTPEGLFHTNWKSKETESTVDDKWVLKWYFNLDSHEGVSLHEYALPGYPVSHSCVRLLSEDAQWIYYWAEQWKVAPDKKTIIENGTPVIIFGDFAYGKTPPWKNLLGNMHAADVSEAEINSAIAKYQPEMKVQPSSPK